MNRTDLVKKISENTGMPQAQVRKVVVAVGEEIHNALIFGMDVKLQEFANFELKVSKETTKTNPATGEKIIAPKRYRVKITLPKTFDQRLRKKIVY